MKWYSQSVWTFSTLLLIGLRSLSISNRTLRYKFTLQNTYLISYVPETKMHVTKLRMFGSKGTQNMFQEILSSRIRSYRRLTLLCFLPPDYPDHGWIISYFEFDSGQIYLHAKILVSSTVRYILSICNGLSSAITFRECLIHISLLFIEVDPEFLGKSTMHKSFRFSFCWM